MSRKVFCPHCGGVHEVGTRCPSLPPRKRKPTPGDATRGEREPWRREYGRAAHQRERQDCMERQQGRCIDCGAVCAAKVNGRWVTRGHGGEVDHVTKLRFGGRRCALRCKRCHARKDAAQRRHGR